MLYSSICEVLMSVLWVLSPWGLNHQTSKVWNGWPAQCQTYMYGYFSSHTATPPLISHHHLDHHQLADTKLHCLMTEAQGYKQHAQSRYAAAPRPGVQPAPLDHKYKTQHNGYLLYNTKPAVSLCHPTVYKLLLICFPQKVWSRVSPHKACYRQLTTNWHFAYVMHLLSLLYWSGLAAQW